MNEVISPVMSAENACPSIWMRNVGWKVSKSMRPVSAQTTRLVVLQWILTGAAGKVSGKKVRRFSW